MKTYFFICSCCFLFFAVSHAQQAHDAKDSSQASPEFSFVTLSDQQILSGNLKGKVIVLDFWSTDCGPCRKSMPQMEKFYRRYKDNPRVAVYLVNSGWEPIEKAQAFASSRRSGFLFFSWGTKYELPFAYDNGSATLKAFNLNSNPSTIIIDKSFRIRVRHSGYIEKFDDFLTENVERYLNEQ